LPKRAVLQDIGEEPRTIDDEHDIIYGTEPAFKLKFKISASNIKEVLIPVSSICKKVDKEFFKDKVLTEARIYQEVSKA